MNEVKYDPELCVKYAYINQLLIVQSEQVGCFGCLYIFPANKAQKFHEGTGYCPHCTRFTLLPDATGVPLDASLLLDIYYWWRDH